MVTAGKVAAETVAAVNRAGAGHHYQSAAAVFVEHGIDRGRREFANRVGGEAGRRVVLLQQRQDLAQQWVRRISGAHPVDERTWYPERESAQDGRGCSRGRIPEVEQSQQFRDISDNVGEILPPRTGGPRGITFLYHPAQFRSIGMIGASKEIRRWLPTT
jgi:hypothetical protein